MRLRDRRNDKSRNPNDGKTLYEHLCRSEVVRKNTSVGIAVGNDKAVSPRSRSTRNEAPFTSVYYFS